MVDGAMVFGQVEKLLMQALLDPGFRNELVTLGQSAAPRFACSNGEADVLGALLAHDGAGLAAVLSVLDSAIDVRVSLGLYGKPPHELPDRPVNQFGSGAQSTAINAYAG
jgi:hypothetical protein